MSMAETTYRGRHAFKIENDQIRVTVLQEGGHIAEIVGRGTGLNPLWTPPWPSIEPSTYSVERHPEYGSDAESRLLAGIMGHNLCLDIFGEPSVEEANGRLTVHGEAPVARYEIVPQDDGLVMHAEFAESRLRFERRLRLWPTAAVVEFGETVENLSATDRPIAWTEHVTLGPPFLEKGATQFRVSATRSKVFENQFGDGDYMLAGAEFEWPFVPRAGGGFSDLRVFTGEPASCGFTTHLMDPHRDMAYFLSFSPKARVAFGYVWRRADFPWLGIWEENFCRTQPPWNGRTLTRGMEFGASPMPETRRRMIERGNLFGIPAYRWIPAKSCVEVRYRAAIAVLDSTPESLVWSDEDGAIFVP